MDKCVFFNEIARPKPDKTSGFFFFNDFNDLCSHLIKVQFYLVFVFSCVRLLHVGFRQLHSSVAINSAQAYSHKVSYSGCWPLKIAAYRADLSCCCIGYLSNNVIAMFCNFVKITVSLLLPAIVDMTQSNNSY